MDILDKFAAVEIQADTRISDCDRAFCLRQQEAFDKSGPALQRVVDAILEADAQQDAIFKDNTEDFRDYTGSRDLTPEKVYDLMKDRNDRFIDAIVNYFRRTYSVKLDADMAKDHLIPVRPHEPSSPYYGWGPKPDPEEIQEYKEKLEAYKKEKEAWEKRLRDLPLRYEDVVDEVITQLGGFSFQERALNELKERSWKSAHRSYLNKNETFEIKGPSIHLQDCTHTNWEGKYFQRDDDLCNLLDAVAYYDHKQMDAGAKWFPELYRYDIYEYIFEFPTSPHLESVRLFKNGRVDLKFRSPAYAHEFAEQFLRSRPIAVCA